MIRRWGLPSLGFALGLALLGLSFNLQVSHDQRLERLETNGTKVLGNAEWTRTYRHHTLTVTYSQREQRIRCHGWWDDCRTGPREVWFDPADPSSIALPGVRLPGVTRWRYEAAIAGLAIIILASVRIYLRGDSVTARRRSSLAPKPGQKPSRRRR